MNKADETPNSPKKRSSKRVFRNFAEYWHFLRILTKQQQDVIAGSLTASERKALKLSYEKGAWNQLFMRNACDFTIDRLKEHYGVDLLDLRMKVISGKPQLIQKSFWEYVKSCFEDVAWVHQSYIFGGLKEESFDSEYIKLVAQDSKSQPKGE